MPKPKLSSILEAMELSNDELHSYVDRETGEVVTLSDEELRAAEDEDDPSDYPEWQRESIERAKAVLSAAPGRFAPLPDRFEIDEWAMMRAFALSSDDEAAKERLLHAIHGRGAFRYFKDSMHELGLADRWYEFRDGEYRRVALEWCAEHAVKVDVEP